MNSAELTALHTETLNEIRRARLLANITRRAAILFEVGYTVKETLTGLYVRSFQVTSPEGKTYRVKISQGNAEPGTFFGSGCNCPCFEKETICKHLLAIENMIAEEEAIDQAYEIAEEVKNYFDSRMEVDLD